MDTKAEKAVPVEYDHNSPVVKALEAAHLEWLQGNCQDPACGCWTVIANNHLAPVIDAIRQKGHKPDAS